MQTGSKGGKRCASCARTFQWLRPARLGIKQLCFLFFTLLSLSFFLFFFFFPFFFLITTSLLPFLRLNTTIRDGEWVEKRPQPDVWERVGFWPTRLTEYCLLPVPTPYYPTRLHLSQRPVAGEVTCFSSHRLPQKRVVYRY